MTELQASHVFALNVANAALGIVVAMLVLAVLVPALYDATARFRRRRSERRQAAATRAQRRAPWSAPATGAAWPERDAL